MRNGRSDLLRALGVAIGLVVVAVWVRAVRSLHRMLEGLK